MTRGSCSRSCCSRLPRALARGRVLREPREPDPDRRDFRREPEPARRLWRPAVARTRRVARRRRLHLAPGSRSTRAWPLGRGADRARRQRRSMACAVRLDLAARDRARLSHAHAGAVAGAVGHGLPLGVGDRRRQRPARPDAARALRHRSGRARLLSTTSRCSSTVIAFCADGASSSLRLSARALQGHARPAAPHERARA